MKNIPKFLITYVEGGTVLFQRFMACWEEEAGDPYGPNYQHST